MDLEKEATISLASVNDDNIMQLKKLNDVLFPNRFNQEFYDQALQALRALASRDFTKLALYGDICVGAILCDLEKEDDGVSRVHVMTFGVLESYRRNGIGTKLMNHVLDRCSKENVSEIYLNVHTNNEDAINFYQKLGFEMSDIVPNYYKNTPSSPNSFKFTKIIAANEAKKRPFSEVNTTEETLGSCSDMGDSSDSKKCEEEDLMSLEEEDSPQLEEEDLISLVSVTDENLDQLKELTKVLFPSLYNDDHFADSLASGDFTQLALYDEYCVGAVECRLERKPDGSVARVYVKNLGVLEPSRRRGIGTRLMNHVLDCCFKERVLEVYVHVSRGNENAINFYKKFGFEKERTVFGYYENPKTPGSYYVFRATMITN